MASFSEDQITKLMDLLEIPSKKRNFEEFQDQIKMLKAFYQSKTDNSLEKILNNPGLQHIAEKIVENLKYEDLEMIGEINQSSKQILNHQMKKPMFLLRKFRGLTKKNQNNWIKVIESEKNFNKEKAIASYLLWNLKKDALVNLSHYSSPTVQDDFRKTIREICEKKMNFSGSDEDTEIVKILAPLTANPNAEGVDGWTPIDMVALCGCTEIVETLAPLADNSNPPNYIGETAMHLAAPNGYIEVVKILVPLTANPDAEDDDGNTPIFIAAQYGHTEIFKILAPLTAKPNAADDDGNTLIYWAAFYGLTEIVKILVPLTDNPNAADNQGKTPIYWAAYKGHTEIVKILAPLTANPNAEDEDKDTPILIAARHGYSEIVKILAPLTDNPNATNYHGETPIKVTKNAEIRKFLESFNTANKRKVGQSTKLSSKRAKKN